LIQQEVQHVNEHSELLDETMGSSAAAHHISHVGNDPECRE
jgi:hypothetical protein